MHLFVIWELIALWIVWVLPVFVKRISTWNVQRARTDYISLVGMLLQALGYPLVAPGADFKTLPLPLWSVSVGSVFAVVAVVSIWAAIPALGRQWRLAAGVNKDHVLVKSGPYAIVRHPIYFSMLALLLAFGFLSGAWLRLGVALVIFAMGTAIRVNREEILLRERFGKEFDDYRARVPALIPRFKAS